MSEHLNELYSCVASPNAAATSVPQVSVRFTIRTDGTTGEPRVSVEPFDRADAADIGRCVENVWRQFRFDAPPAGRTPRFIVPVRICPPD